VSVGGLRILSVEIDFCRAKPAIQYKFSQNYASNSVVETSRSPWQFGGSAVLRQLDGHRVLDALAACVRTRIGERIGDLHLCRELNRHGENWS